jgi:large subunit ribosomal protein L25
LDLGQALYVKDLKLPEGMEAELDEEEIIAIVSTPSGLEVEEETGEEESAEPEVIEKGKKEEE